MFSGIELVSGTFNILLRDGVRGRAIEAPKAHWSPQIQRNLIHWDVGLLRKSEVSRSEYPTRVG
jgi:hypothetical protein